MSEATPAALDDRRAEALREGLSRRLAEAAALFLWRLGAVRIDVAEPFRLASGGRSPFYVDCRLAVSSPPLLQLFCAAVRHRADERGLRIDVVAGGETAGIPFAAVLATALGKPMVYVRKKPKGYGTGSRIEGILPRGARVLLVEDLVTDGGSKLAFLDAIADAGAEVRDAAVLFDRQQGGAAALGERGVALHAVTDRATALAVAADTGLLGAGERAEVEGYFRDPEGWQKARGFEMG